MASNQKPLQTTSETMKKLKRNSALAKKALEKQKRAREKKAAKIAARVPGEGYEPCIASFIDVLGFKNLLETHHADDIRDILLNLRKFTAPDPFEISLGKNLSSLISQPFAESVSDAVIRVRTYDTEFHDGAFIYELLDLLYAQIKCIKSGITIRAGMMVGPAHVGRNGKGPLFGPAVVRAIEIERCEAKYPRIVVDPCAYNAFLRDSRLRTEGNTIGQDERIVNRLLRIDTDGRRFIDYLYSSEYELEYPYAYYRFLSEHAEFVRKKLGETECRVREKFDWLANYHDSFVKQKITRYKNNRQLTHSFHVEFGFNPLDFLQTLIVESK